MNESLNVSHCNDFDFCGYWIFFFIFWRAIEEEPSGGVTCILL